MIAPTLILRVAGAATLNFIAFEGNQAIVSPLAPLDPTSDEHALDTIAARVDPLFIDQLAERQALWVRDLVAKGTSEITVRSGLDAVDSWSHRASRLRAEAADILLVPNQTALAIALITW